MKTLTILIYSFLIEWILLFKKTLQYRYSCESLDYIIKSAAKAGRLQDVKACIKYGVSTSGFIGALNSSVSARHPSIYLFLFNNFPHQLIPKKSDILEDLLDSALLSNIPAWFQLY
jgi:hypothetical protein